MMCYYSTDSIISMLNDFSYSSMFSAINQFLTKGSSVSSPLVFLCSLIWKYLKYIVYLLK